MSKKNYMVKIIFVIVLIASSLLITGCSNNGTELLNVSNYDVNYTVLDESNVPIEGAVVTLDGTSKTTDSNGVVTFSKPNGTYDYSVTASEYETVQDTVIVNGDNLTIDVILTMLIRYNINFTVTDTASNPKEGATITLDNESKTTDNNGEVTFSKPDGSYDYSVTLTGYDTIYDTAVVNGDNISIEKNLTQLAPDEYNITFTVTDTGDIPIEGATVNLDSVDKTTDANGMVTFTKPDGTYNYSVVKTGYNTLDDTTVVNGADVTEIVSLQIAPPAGYIGIYNWQDLDNIRNDLTADYILMNNIDSSSEYYNDYASSIANSNTGWLPIGNDTNKFTGTFDGNNYVISDLYINRPSKVHVGLFGYINGGTVQNLKLESFNISGYNRVGSIAGISDNSSIIDSSFSGGSIVGVSNVGGLVGHNFKGIISNSYTTTSVSGDPESNNSRIGGLVGSNEGSIKNSYATGNVTGFERVGGLVGHNVSGIESSYSTASVSGKDIYIGGLVGYNTIGHITKCYAIGDVISETLENDVFAIGGLVGYNRATISQSYSNNTVTGTSSSNTIKYVGGLVGNNYGNITNSYSLSTISGNNLLYVGGLVGYNTYSGALVENTYAAGNIEVVGGGEIGLAFGKAIGSVTDSFAYNNPNNTYSYFYDGSGCSKAGRVTEAPHGDMTSNLIYTQKTGLAGYDDMIEVWDTTLWNFGTDTNPAYPSLSWE